MEHIPFQSVVKICPGLYIKCYVMLSLGKIIALLFVILLYDIMAEKLGFVRHCPVRCTMWGVSGQVLLPGCIKERLCLSLNKIF
jgi:hypothetical protein